MTTVPTRTRFAPSPTGFLHLGNARTALFSALLARSRGGRFILRIEDTDLARGHADFETALMEDMAWLGLAWDEGPDCDGGKGPYRQSEREAIYAESFARLEATDLAYPCYCSQRELEMARKAQLAAGQPPRYPGTCAELDADARQLRAAQGRVPTLRFRVPAGRSLAFEDIVRGEQVFNSDDLGDFIIRRADGSPAFFFSNAVDDALMGVTDVLRGEDHLANTPRQLLLLEALELPQPRYGHVGLVTGSDGAPLSKRHGSAAVRDIRREGFLPEAVNNHLARLGHTYAEPGYMSLDELVEGFDPAHLGRSPAQFDRAQLIHWQKEALHAAGDDVLAAWLDSHGVLPEEIPASARMDFVCAIRDNIVLPVDAAQWVYCFFGNIEPSHEARAAITAAGAEFFTVADGLVDGSADFSAFARAVGAATSRKGKALYMPLRAALTGEVHGPEMARAYPLLAREVVHERIENARRLALGD